MNHINTQPRLRISQYADFCANANWLSGRVAPPDLSSVLSGYGRLTNSWIHRRRHHIDHWYQQYGESGK